MKIGIDSNFKIKQLYDITDKTLKEIEVDREKVFHDMSDYMILNYCYEEKKLGYSVYPSVNYDLLLITEHQENKISILEAENSALLESQKVQDRTIVENDMRMMDLEWALEDLITSINPTAKINLTEVFTMFGRSSTYFNQLKQMIEMENYDSKEDMERILNKYAAGSRPRITQEEYDQLFDLLYPPVYDIPTTIPEV